MVEIPFRIGEQEVQRIVKTVAESIVKAMGLQQQLYRIVGPEDDKTCEHCKGWVGKIVVMSPDGKHRTVDDFVLQHGFHPNCRHMLQMVDSVAMNNNADIGFNIVIL